MSESKGKRCRCEWHVGEVGPAQAPPCDRALVEVREELRMDAVNAWTVKQSRQRRERRIRAAEGGSTATALIESAKDEVQRRRETRRRSRVAVKALPEDVRKAMNAYALRKSRGNAQ